MRAYPRSRGGTSSAASRACRSWAYPRSRGGTSDPSGISRRGLGLSPLARGNQRQGRARQQMTGLSPLARGNRSRRNPGRRGWPIPARAGEPVIHGLRLQRETAYPRSRGGTPARRWMGWEWAYPRSRGGTPSTCRRAPTGRPIPARAGEPLSFMGGPFGDGAYPRSRGGTCGQTATPGARCGPIPARAGEPPSTTGRWIPSRAYPRSRGATRTAAVCAGGDRGLSPLARGNLKRRWRCSCRQHGPIPARAGQPDGPAASQIADGPIPARAGEPNPRRPSVAELGAYPRSRGATLRWMPLAAQGTGPIPARAGQPAVGSRASRLHRAYPRSRGATSSSQSNCGADRGLSPLARGNRRAVCVGVGRLRPIPARAGQPCGQATP